VLSTNQFTWIPERRELVAEASDLGSSFQLEQLYVDACDEGVKIISDRTGQEAAFYLVQRKTDGEGDLLAWVFEPTLEAIRKQPQLAGVKVVVLND
jgi:hypothetical protein